MAKGDFARLATCDLREEKHLTVGGDRLEEGVLVNLAVDGDSHALSKVRLDLWMQLGELLEELLHPRRRELELGDAPREPREAAEQNNARHPCQTLLSPRALSAFNTFGGDIGSSVKRVPVAVSMAFAVAPRGGRVARPPSAPTP